MTSTVKRLSPVLAEVSVEIQEAEVAKALDRAYEELSRKIRVPGFRPGKAPRSVLKRLYGPAVRAEVRSDLMADKLYEALREHDIEPVSPPRIEDASEITEGAPLVFTARVELRPRLDRVDWEGIEVVRRRVEVSPADVDKEIERLRSFTATIADPPEPRPVAAGDLVKIEAKRWTDGEWKDAPWPAREIVVGDGSLSRDIEDALVGANVGEERVVDLGSKQEMETERVRYLVRVLSIRERRLPALDDEWAKDVSDFETLESLRADIEKRLRATLERQEDERIRSEIVAQLCRKNPMDLPPDFVERQSLAMQERLRGAMAVLGGPEMGEEERKNLVARTDARSRAVVHWYFLFQELARNEAIEVRDEDIEEAFTRMARERDLPVPKIRAEFAEDKRLDELRLSLLEDKVFAFLLERVKIAPDEEKALSQGSPAGG